MMRRWCWFMIALLLGLLPMTTAAGAVGTTDTQPSATDNPLAAQPLDYLSATRDRPLFLRSRRPPAPPPSVVKRVEPPPPPIPPPSVVLLGVVADDNGAFAIVRFESGNNVIRAHVGEEIEGWNVTEIESRRLVLSRDGRSVSFALFVNAQRG
jgi:general secretion pathway protein N